MNQFLSVELADRLCLVLLHSLWQSALLALVAVAASRWLHRGRVEAAYRWHAAALVGCFGCATAHLRMARAEHEGGWGAANNALRYATRYRGSPAFATNTNRHARRDHSPD